MSDYFDHRATYSPEDNKLRVYPGSRLDDELGEEYAAFKAAGYKWAAKQECFVCPRWTPQAEDWALRLCGEIDDEDYSAVERSADRAERFEGYREKRQGEARSHADTFDSGPAAFGHQNRQRAERQAARHDRHRRNAVSQWSKAEYWQTRTAGVISHALYRSSAPVRRSRLLRLEAEKRKHDSTVERQRTSYTAWLATDEAKQDAEKVARIEKSFANCERWTVHYDLRMNYEKAMLEAEGGMAAEVEMEPGGWIRPGSRAAWMLRNVGDRWLQIHKVNKSSVTGRVVSVGILALTSSDYDRHGEAYGEDNPRPEVLHTVNVERLGEDCFRPPTDEEREAFAKAKKAAKASRKTISLINPTDEDADRLQAHLNGIATAAKPTATTKSVERVKMAAYQRFSGDDGIYRVRQFDIDGQVFKVRCRRSGFWDYHAADTVLVIEDRPQKPIPVEWPSEEPAIAGMLF